MLLLVVRDPSTYPLRGSETARVALPDHALISNVTTARVSTTQHCNHAATPHHTDADWLGSRWPLVRDEIATTQPDIVCFQEVQVEMYVNALFHLLLSFFCPSIRTSMWDDVSVIFFCFHSPLSHLCTSDNASKLDPRTTHVTCVL